MKKTLTFLGLGTTMLVPAMAMVSCSKNSEKQILSLVTNFSEHNYSLIQVNNLSIPSTNINDYYIKDSNGKEIEIYYNESTVKDETLNLKTSFIDSKKNADIIIYCKTNSSFKLIVKHFKTFSPNDINENKQYFFDLIKDMSQNNIPTIIESRDASLTIQQCFYISLVNYFNNIDNLNSNDISIFMTHDLTIKSHRFDEQVLIDNGISSGVKTIEEINSSNISNLNIINKFKHPNTSSAYEFISHLDLIQEKFNITTKFDFVISDLSLITWIQNAISNPKGSKLEYILKKANRIIVVSDGAAHTNDVTPYLNEILYDYEPSSREETINNFNLFLEGKKDLSKEMILDLLLIKNFECNNIDSKFDFISFMNYDANVHNSLSIEDENMWSLNPFSTNFTEYASLIDGATNKEKYLDVYSKLFVGENTLNDIIIHGLDAYDPNKRNAIFLGSSLFKPISGDMTKDNFSRLQYMSNLRKVVQDQMKELLARFPQDEYNIIFKLHPVYIDDAAIEYVKLITDNIIENPIIISPNIPLETLIANDYYNYSSNQGENFIFKQNEKHKAYEWTTFFGLQTTSTTIHTTRLFYQTSFDLSKEQIAELIPFYNFPVPTKFPVVSRLESDLLTKDYYEENMKTIMNIYSPFCPSITYNNEELKPYDSIILNFEK